MKTIEMADIMRALESVRGAPVLTSNQCADLAKALNAAALAECHRNQCDGCQAGKPLENGNIHRMGDNGYPDFMSCTARLYISKPELKSIVLPDRMEEAYFPEDTPYENRIWNSCLDKIKELNQ